MPKIKVLLASSVGEKWKVFDSPTEDAAAWISKEVQKINVGLEDGKKIEIKEVIYLEDGSMGGTKTVGASMREIPLEELSTSKTNPRRHHDAVADDALADSIGKHGVLQPILARLKDGKFQIVAGERRFRAARKAKLKSVPAQVQVLSDTEVMEIQVTENLQRQDVHPLDEAAAFLVMRDRLKLPEEEIGRRVSKTKGYVVRRIKLLDLIPKAQELFLGGDVNIDHAQKICRLSERDQKELLKNLFERGYRTDCDFVIAPGALDEYIHANVLMKLKSAAWDMKDGALVSAAGSCAECPKRSGNNPDLFGDVVDGDRCTDRICFEKKQNAHLQKSVVDAKESKTLLVKISGGWATNKGVLGSNSYNLLKSKAKPCPNKKKAIVVDDQGHNLSRGAIVSVCTGKQCRVHGVQAHTGLPMKSDAQRQNDRKKKHLEKVAHTIRRTTLLGILDKVQSPMIPELLRLTCNSLFREMYYEDRKRLTELHGWMDEMRVAFDAKRKGKKERFTPDIDEFAHKRISSMDSKQLARFLIAASLVGQLQGPGYIWDDRKMVDRDALMAEAKRCGVDVGKIRAAVTKEMPYIALKKKKPEVKKTGKKTAPKAKK